MPDYRVYTMTKDTHVEGPAAVVTCDSDQEAIRQAKQMVDGHDVELWDGGRFVTRIRGFNVPETP
jgi:hypothetical protein